MNGRITELGMENCQDLSQLYTEVCDNLNGYKKESINHLLEENNVNQYFFSKENIDRIQNNIRYQVYQQSNNKINRQSDRELNVIMRSMYLQYSSNNDNYLKSEIEYLNKLVIDYCVPKIITNLTQYIGYKKDITTMYTPMDMPQTTNVAGENSLTLNNPF